MGAGGFRHQTFERVSHNLADLNCLLAEQSVTAAGIGSIGRQGGLWGGISL